MFSISSPTTTTTRLLFPNPNPHFAKPHHHHHRCRRSRYLNPNTYASVGPIPPPAPNGPAPRTLFPGGFKRPEIQIPALVLRVTADDVNSSDGGAAAVGAAVGRGVGIVVLDVGEEGGGRVYEAARALKSLVGDRAYLLIADRVDVAAAVGANGVVLSDDGIPAIVARSMMMKSNSDSIYLPLVARTIQSAKSAISASNSEGADFLIVNTSVDDFSWVLNGTATQQVKIPIFCTLPTLTDQMSPNVTSKLLHSGASGFVFSLAEMQLFTDDLLKKMFSKACATDSVLLDKYSSSSKLEANNTRLLTNEKKTVSGFTKLDQKVMQLIEVERLLISEAVAVIRKAAPTMEEVPLLVDAASRLSEPFLLVVVGEFNSGKSTFINALLGRRYLQEGVVPTTNEIMLLSYSDNDSDLAERCERHPDGQFVCYLSTPILKEMILVDTPGTNVILQRQQRLTEEFVPRADLILFVLSADRPLTDSEVAFLLYVQQWKKKVVFVLNKLDLYRSSDELEEATTFIKENVRKLLNTENVLLFPVSSRLALEVKLSYINDGVHYEEVLLSNPRWRSSKFNELENFLFSFLDGSTDNGKERVQLKLETPIAIADRLLTSCEKIVKLEYENAIQDLTSIKDVVSGANKYLEKIEAESIALKKQILSLIETAKAQAVALMDSTLQLSNINLVSTYSFKGERSSSTPVTSSIENDILSPACSNVEKLLLEYSRWLESTNSHEAKFYVESFHKRWGSLVDLKDRVQSDASNGNKLSTEVLANFSANAASKVFEQEIREVALGTFGGLGAAGLSASLLTSVLPTTLEDLLALGLCSAGGLLAISNFPNRRKNAVEKVKRAADALSRKVEDAMQKDLLQSADKLVHYVEVSSKPYQDAAQRRIDWLQGIQSELSSIECKFQNFKIEIQNLHVS